MSKTLKSIIGELSNVVYEQLITSSQSFTPAHDTEAVVYVCGGGGSGGAGFSSTTNALASGGGAGEISIIRTRLYRDIEYTATIAAGGWGVTATPHGIFTYGNAGGATSFAGGDINVTAGGGQGGQAAGGLGVMTLANGGAGGTGGTGGALHYSGGRGGNIECDTATVFAGLVSGGGGVNVFGWDQTRGGDISFSDVPTPPTANVHIATGGGGVYGHGGDSNDNSACATGGGTGFSNGKSNISSATDTGITNAISGVLNVVFTTNIRGTGGKAQIPNSNFSDPTLFGGSGGYLNAASGAPVSRAGGLGAGSGGCVQRLQTGGAPTTGPGGDGFVLIQYLEAINA